LCTYIIFTYLMPDETFTCITLFLDFDFLSSFLRHLFYFLSFSNVTSFHVFIYDSIILFMTHFTLSLMKSNALSQIKLSTYSLVFNFMKINKTNMNETKLTDKIIIITIIILTITNTKNNYNNHIYYCILLL
jgi:hypothetical protein